MLQESVDLVPQVEEEKLSPDEVCRQYRKLSRKRPPFEYTAGEPQYPEASEARLFAMEKRCFDLSSYPTPPSDVPALQTAYAALQIRHRELTETISSIKSLDGLHADNVTVDTVTEDTRTKLELGKLPPHNDPIQIKELFENEKKYWEDHYNKKKLFFHQALAYLALAEAYHPEDDQKARSKRFSCEVYTMFIGHQGTTYSRSASHELGPLRRDKQPTIKHPYTVAVDGFNFFMKKIEAAESIGDEGLIYQLFEELQMDLIRSLFHDTLEDYFLTESDLGCKLVEMLNFDLRIGPRMREADTEKRLPENMNFADKRRKTIMSELWCLKEEDEDKDATLDAPYYLTKKLPQIRKYRRPYVFLTKIRDRRNNLQSPKYKKKGKTLVKLAETLKILATGMDIIQLLSTGHNQSLITPGDVKDEMARLIDVAESELGKYSASEEYRSLVAQSEDWKTFMEATNRSFSEYKHRLAA